MKNGISFELRIILQKEAERLQKIEAMRPEERERYAAGIEKLRRRVDELREATGMTAEDFAAQMRDAIGGLTAEQTEALSLDAVLMRLEEAQEAWRGGDAARMETAFRRLREMTDAVRRMKERQEAFL